MMNSMLQEIHYDPEKFWKDLPLILGRRCDEHGAFCVGLLAQKARQRGGYPTFAAMWEATRQEMREFYTLVNE